MPRPLVCLLTASALCLTGRALGVIAAPYWLCALPGAVALGLASAGFVLATFDRPHHLEDA